MSRIVVAWERKGSVSYVELTDLDLPDAEPFLIPMDQAEDVAIGIIQMKEQNEDF